MTSAANDCKEALVVVPVIDLNRCEGKNDCVEVCPYGVFEVRPLPVTERAQLSVKGRIKSFFHGYRKAFVVKPQECHACGKCVTACPEKAIKLSAVK